MGLFDFLKKPKKTPLKKAQKNIQKKIMKKIQKQPQKKLQGEKAPQKIKEKQIGIITHSFNKISVGIIKLKSGLKTGDKIHIKGAHDDFTQVVASMQVNHKDISSAGKGAEVGIKVIKRVHENDKVYKTAGEEKK